MSLSPIILFVYNRALYAKHTLRMLEKNHLAQDSVLYIYADGAKENASQDQIKKISEVRKIIQENWNFKEIHLVERAKNFGLANSIISGVTEVINKHGKAIIVEDDLELSPYFLQYMNESLDLYEDEEKVWSIGACNFFSTYPHTPDTFFIPIPDCWGWATWKDRWQFFEPDSNKLLQQLKDKNLENAFNLFGGYDFIGMLKAQAEGKISSWAIRWQAQAYLHDALSLYPKYALTNHMSSVEATHSTNFSTEKHITFPKEKINVVKQEVQFLKDIEKDMIRGYKHMSNSSAITSPKRISKKQIIKKFIPPIILEFYRSISGKKLLNDSKKSNLYWQGNYNSWHEAQKIAEGYDAPQILEKVREATLKVKNGKAVYERDSVIFDKIQYNWQLLACLLKIAVENNSELNIIDFGGSLGSSYFQNKEFLKGLKKITWTVVEQKHFVECGKKDIAHNGLDFAQTIEGVLQLNSAKILLLSGVIQYLEKPYELIERQLQFDFEYIIIDRTAFIEDLDDRLTVQYVPEWIYKASYPAWFFNEYYFLSKFEKKYAKIVEFDSFADGVTYLEDGKKCYMKGFLLKLKSHT
jgi:putative methyltransferase (TIGR04325 family)